MAGKKIKVVVGFPFNTIKTCFHNKDWRRLQNQCELIFYNGEQTNKNNLQGINDAEIFMTGWGTKQLTKKQIAEAYNLRLLIHAAGSVAKIIPSTFWNRKILLSTANEILAQGVAETALGYTIMGLKQLLPLSRTMHKERKKIRCNGKFPVRELYQINLGIVGYGQVGRHLRHLLKNFFDLKVMISDPNVPEAEIEKADAVPVSLEEICRQCDVIHNCVPWTPKTEKLFNKKMFSLMKDDAIFINTGRGATVDEQALAAELVKGKLQAYLDVTYPEPPVPGSPLYDQPNCFLFPHVAGFANNGRFRLGQFAVDEIFRFLDGKPLLGLVDKITVERMTGGNG